MLLVHPRLIEWLSITAIKDEPFFLRLALLQYRDHTFSQWHVSALGALRGSPSHSQISEVRSGRWLKPDIRPLEVGIDHTFIDLIQPCRRERLELSRKASLLL